MNHGCHAESDDEDEDEDEPDVPLASTVRRANSRLQDDAGDGNESDGSDTPLVTKSRPTSSLKRKRTVTSKSTADKPRKKQKRQPTNAPAVIKQELESIDIPLPSACPAEVRSRPCLQAAVEIEIAGRKKKANEALEWLRTHLITSYSFSKEKAKRNNKAATPGRKYDLRNTSKIRVKNRNIRRAAAAYRLNHAALAVLGVSDPELPELKAEHVRPFTALTKDRKLGDSKKPISWIWQRVEFVDSEELKGKFSEFTDKGADDLFVWVDARTHVRP